MNVLEFFFASKQSSSLFCRHVLMSENVRYFGVYFHENLSWDYHIKQISKTIIRLNGVLSKLQYVPKIYNLLYGCLQ